MTMKRSDTWRRILQFSLAFCVSAPAFAQITITSSSYTARIGNRETGSDYTANAPSCVSSLLGASGASQTWDFTASCTWSGPDETVVDWGSDVAGDVPMGTDPAFTGANLYGRAYETSPANEESAWAVYNLTASALTQLGFVGVTVEPPDFDTTLIANDPHSLLVKLPLTYGTTWSDSTSFTTDGFSFVGVATDNTVDGWGTLITPAGSASALRISTERRSYVTVGMLVISSDTTYEYGFVTNASIAASIDHDNAGSALEAHYSTSSIAALPVELASFEVIRKGSVAYLSWRTLSESDNSGFAVEHALDGGDFVEIAFVAGVGSSTEEHSYVYALGLEKTGIHRFRLRQVDLDGSFDYSGTVELNYETPDRFALLDAYPNPFNPGTTLAFDLATASDVTLEVYDALGRRVTQLVHGPRPAGRHEVAFDATGLPSGLYLYRLVTRGRSETRSMVLTK